MLMHMRNYKNRLVSVPVLILLFVFLVAGSAAMYALDGNVYIQTSKNTKERITIPHSSKPGYAYTQKNESGTSSSLFVYGLDDHSLRLVDEDAGLSGGGVGLGETSPFISPNKF